MSALLDTLLDAARRAECALHDAEASHAAFSFIPTQEHAMKHVQPIVFQRPGAERTEKDGRRAYPIPLHKEATPEAIRGWTREAVATYIAVRAHAAGSVETALWR
jgi:hypothetical protein